MIGGLLLFAGALILAIAWHHERRSERTMRFAREYHERKARAADGWNGWLEPPDPAAESFFN